MKVIVIGLTNVESNIAVESFPIHYSPIEFSFFKTKTAPSGVGLNLALAFKILNDDVTLYSLGADDFLNKVIEAYLDENEVKHDIQKVLKETPESLVLFDKEGRRKIYCDLKDCQDNNLEHITELDFDLACLTNINFSRPFLRTFKNLNIPIATDCQVLGDVNDEFNHDFLVYSDILFLSDEYIKDRYYSFMNELIEKYDKEIIVISRGAEGVLMYVRKDKSITHFEAYPCEKIVNTVGAGDALFAAFNHYYIKTKDPYKSIKLAMQHASFKISYSGGASGFIKEIDL